MIGFIIQIITGHGPFRYHQWVVDNNLDPTCVLCLEEEETGAHLVLGCPALAREQDLYALDGVDMDDHLKDSTVGSPEGVCTQYRLPS